MVKVTEPDGSRTMTKPQGGLVSRASEAESVRGVTPRVGG